VVKIKSTGELTGRVKRKGVYFNLDDEDELLLYEKANEIRNFSKWVKKQLVNDGFGIKEIKEPKERINENVLIQTKVIERKRAEKDELDDIMI